MTATGTAEEPGRRPSKPTSSPGQPATSEGTPRDALAGPAQVAQPPTGPVDRVVRFARGMGVALAILVFWSAALGLAWFVVPYVMLRERERLARRRRMQRVVAAAWRWFLRVLDRTTLYRCAYEGALAPLTEPVVLVSNHPTLLDVTAIISRAPEVCCVVKSSLMNSPLVGRLLRSCGHVAAGDGSLMSGMHVLEGMRERLAEGFPVLVFPEGTRSPYGGMHRFRRGAFEIAQRAGVPVVPLFLRCDPPALGKGTPVWLHPRRCPTLTVHVGHSVDTNAGDPAELCKSIERDFRSRLLRASTSGEQDT
ncbi:MAG: 1-acyl-sn-glycerol-3-phosphate acyltransferase [Myxococcaceae bacterium]|nr:1-acyl-sn-glycerol-3-phosphate acyltransferase [Myxococcaceae bacterium]